MAPDDARLEPYWSLAEELDRPIAIALGPAAPGDSSPSYRVALGDPLRLESVLVRHPRLRIVVVGGGWPFGDAMAGLMLRYPQVSVDIRPLTRALPDAEVQAYVRRLADAGFAARILNSPREAGAYRRYASGRRSASAGNFARASRTAAGSTSAKRTASSGPPSTSDVAPRRDHGGVAGVAELAALADAVDSGDVAEVLDRAGAQERAPGLAARLGPVGDDREEVRLLGREAEGLRESAGRSRRRASRGRLRRGTVTIRSPPA